MRNDDFDAWVAQVRRSAKCVALVNVAVLAALWMAYFAGLFK